MISNGHSFTSKSSDLAVSELALVIVEPLDGGVRLVNVVHEVELLAEDLAADGAAVAVLVAGRKVAQPKVPPHVALVPAPAEEEAELDSLAEGLVRIRDALGDTLTRM